MTNTARALSFVAALLLAGCAGTNSPQKDEWLVLRGEATPEEIVVVRGKLPYKEIQSRFPVLLRITWYYDSLPDGLPTASEIERGRGLYAALDRIIEGERVYAMSRTVAGARSIYYYVRSAEVHSESLRRYFDSLPPIEVRITAHPEPGWESVRKVLDGVRN